MSRWKVMRDDAGRWIARHVVGVDWWHEVVVFRTWDEAYTYASRRATR